MSSSAARATGAYDNRIAAFRRGLTPWRTTTLWDR